jgi:hypothetical protein
VTGISPEGYDSVNGTNGTTAADTVDGVLLPDAFMALTRNMYDVPFVRPVTVVEVAVEVPSENTDQVVPALDEDSTV